jgi:hypothetical protein
MKRLINSIVKFFAGLFGKSEKEKHKSGGGSGSRRKETAEAGEEEK